MIAPGVFRFERGAHADARDEAEEHKTAGARGRTIICFCPKVSTSDRSVCAWGRKLTGILPHLSVLAPTAQFRIVSIN